MSETDRIREKINRLVELMDNITENREPTQAELDYYPEALAKAKRELWNAELAGKTVDLPGGGTHTFEPIEE